MNLNDLDEKDDEEFEELSEEEILANIPKFENIKLADIIVAHRYLGVCKNLYIPCMEELARRRIFGDNWSFEEYIEDQLNSMPKIQFNLTDVNMAIEQLKKMSAVK
jgi:hypothetical protein